MLCTVSFNNHKNSARISVLRAQGCSARNCQSRYSSQGSVTAGSGSQRRPARQGASPGGFAPPAVTQRRRRVKSQPRGTSRHRPTRRSTERCQRSGKLGAYTFAGGFHAGLRGGGIHLARGRGPAASRTAGRRRARTPRPTPPPAPLRASPP